MKHNHNYYAPHFLSQAFIHGALLHLGPPSVSAPFGLSSRIPAACSNPYNAASINALPNCPIPDLLTLFFFLEFRRADVDSHRIVVGAAAGVNQPRRLWDGALGFWWNFFFFGGRRSGKQWMRKRRAFWSLEEELLRRSSGGSAEKILGDGVVCAGVVRQCRKTKCSKCFKGGGGGAGGGEEEEPGGEKKEKELDKAKKRAGRVRGGSGGNSMCSCGIFSNPCNVQPSSPLSSAIMVSTSASQAHFVASWRFPASSPSPSSSSSSPPLHNSFLPPMTRNSCTQRVRKRVTSPRVSPITVEVKGKNELVVCFGELLIDFVPTVGGLSLADAPAFKKAPGGAPANVACGIAKLGGNAAFVGKVGDDEFGYMLCDVLKDNKVETKGIRFDSQARTALAFVTLRDDGEREFMFYRNPSADMLFQIHELDIDLLKQSSIMHYGSISLITEPSRSTHLEAMRIAKEAGSLLSYDPNLRLPLWSSAASAKEGIKSIWDQADIIKVSDEEVIFLTGGDPKDDSNNMRMFHPRCKLMLVTEGGEGCRYYTQKFKGHVGGVKVQVVDTTGAGDAFCAGLLSQIAASPSIMDDEPKLRDALLFANACGAITTTERGAIPSLPDKAMVAKLIRKPSLSPATSADPSWQGYQRWRYRNSTTSL